MQKLNSVGCISMEMEEIKKMQKSTDSFLSMWSNTCADFFTVICC